MSLTYKFDVASWLQQSAFMSVQKFEISLTCVVEVCKAQNFIV